MKILIAPWGIPRFIRKQNTASMGNYSVQGHQLVH